MNFPSPSSSDSVIAVNELTCRFGTKVALDALSLYVPRGAVFGLVGENGAGKTTLIKHLLGLLTPAGGQVRVFGLDPIHDSPAVLARLGYLSEHRELPQWMRVDELLRFTSAFYPGWDKQYAEQLREQFHLDPAARVKTLSQGQQAKAGLVVALGHRPELLILDEPSTGLDPVVRKDILEAIIHTIGEEGRSVLFSSHLLDEIERVSDQIGMVRQGKMVLHGPLDGVKQSHRWLLMRFSQPLAKAPTIPGALAVNGLGREWRILCNGSPTNWTAVAASLGAEILEEKTPTLDEIFVARVKGVGAP
ncbi:MAG TPA: ABC transporter ATP-binding protein [Candidatus Limnocylindria bacterium]|jgi:ABC-2 type transport system ATP-binding protein|nr:ABC transporter ATP-binding protein [Candidatus Limnocylindria bacterium]